VPRRGDAAPGRAPGGRGGARGRQRVELRAALHLVGEQPAAAAPSDRDRPPDTGSSSSAGTAGERPTGATGPHHGRRRARVGSRSARERAACVPGPREMARTSDQGRWRRRPSRVSVMPSASSRLWRGKLASAAPAVASADHQQHERQRPRAAGGEHHPREAEQHVGRDDRGGDPGPRAVQHQGRRVLRRRSGWPGDERSMAGQASPCRRRSTGPSESPRPRCVAPVHPRVGPPGR
jgi:hypothetical protein